MGLSNLDGPKQVIFAFLVTSQQHVVTQSAAEKFGVLRHKTHAGSEIGRVDLPQVNAIGTAVFLVSITLVVIAQMLVMGRAKKPESA